MERFDPERVLDAAERLYMESSDAELRAKAVTAVYFMRRETGAKAVRANKRRLELIRRAVQDTDPKVATVAVISLRRLSSGTDEDRRLVRSALERATDGLLIAACLGTCSQWQYEEPIIAEVLRQAPDVGDVEAYQLWESRLEAALAQLPRVRWPGGRIPDSIVHRLTDLITHHPTLLVNSGNALVAARGKQAVPGLLVAYAQASPSPLKAALGALIVAIDPTVAEVRREIPRLQEYLIASRPERDLAKVPMSLGHFNSWVIRAYVNMGETDGVLRLWRAQASLPEEERADLLLGMVIQLGVRKADLLALLTSIPDGELLLLLRQSGALRHHLLLLFGSPGQAGPATDQDDPALKAAESRVCKLVMEAEHKSGESSGDTR